MRLLKVINSQEGDILADDVFSDNGIILAAKNTVINEYIKNKLIDFGIYEFKIYDSDENSDKFAKLDKYYKVCVVQMKELLKDVALGDYRNIKKVVYNITNQVYKNISESDNIIQYLQRIRSIDEYTYNHSINVAFYSMLIGDWNKMSKKQLYELICTGLLHDIGKTEIPLDILNKKGRLSSDEFDIVKKHPVLGYNIIKNMPELNDDIKRGILMHHERIDGSGYPFGIKGDSISIYAKVIAIADVYDAMTQNRIYKKKVSPFETFEMFLTEGVRLFDYSLLYEFLRQIAPFYIGTKVELSNGDIGEVVFIPPQDIMNPILSVNSEYLDLSQKSDIHVMQVV